MRQALYFIDQLVRDLYKQRKRLQAMRDDDKSQQVWRLVGKAVCSHATLANLCKPSEARVPMVQFGRILFDITHVLRVTSA